jgi:hypothetical protein
MTLRSQGSVGHGKLHGAELEQGQCPIAEIIWFRHVSLSSRPITM